MLVLVRIHAHYPRAACSIPVMQTAAEAAERMGARKISLRINAAIDAMNCCTLECPVTAKENFRDEFGYC
jgi:hypothetical protein